MEKGVIRLLRTPLREGEPPYALSNIDQGLFVDGNKKGEKMPRTFRHAQILKDGRLLWELPDTEINREMVNTMLPTIPNPPFAYSVEFPSAVGKPKAPENSDGTGKVPPAAPPATEGKPKVRKPKAAKAEAPAPKTDPQPAPPVPQEQGRKPSRSKGKTASGGK